MILEKTILNANGVDTEAILKEEFDKLADETTKDGGKGWALCKTILLDEGVNDKTKKYANITVDEARAFSKMVVLAFMAEQHSKLVTKLDKRSTDLRRAFWTNFKEKYQETQEKDLTCAIGHGAIFELALEKKVSEGLSLLDALVKAAQGKGGLLGGS
jgi:hypothetical protein